MGVVFTQGQTLGRGDLDIFLSNSQGNVANAYAITYAIYYIDPSSQAEVLIGSATRTPVNPAVGEYYASLMVPAAAQPGNYRIRWTFQDMVSSPDQAVVQEFGVVGTGTDTGTSTTLNGCKADLVKKLRFMLRDNNPDKNYHFRPPEGEGTVGCYNQVFGYIWEDEELLQYLEIALDKWNMHPPETEELCDIEALCQRKPSWRAALLWGALVNAAQALAYNWIADEFDYSIGGISLSIDKSSKYESLKQNAEDQWDKLTEAKARTTKFMRGLKQPRFGIGVRSAFGPHVGRSVLSPRSFLVLLAYILPPMWYAVGYAHHLSAMLS